VDLLTGDEKFEGDNFDVAVGCRAHHFDMLGPEAMLALTTRLCLPHELVFFLREDFQYEGTCSTIRKHLSCFIFFFWPKLKFVRGNNDDNIVIKRQHRLLNALSFAFEPTLYN